MNVNIKKMTEEQLLDLQSQIETQLSKPKYPPRGTICEVWDNSDEATVLRYSNANGQFSISNDLAGSTEWDNYRVVSQGLTFSDDVIKTEDITPEMDKTLCLCWDATDMPSIRAINCKNGTYYKYNGAYYFDGTRNGAKWQNYRLCTTPYELMPQWAKDIIDKLED